MRRWCASKPPRIRISECSLAETRVRQAGRLGPDPVQLGVLAHAPASWAPGGRRPGPAAGAARRTATGPGSGPRRRRWRRGPRRTGVRRRRRRWWAGPGTGRRPGTGPRCRGGRSPGRPPSPPKWIASPRSPPSQRNSSRGIHDRSGGGGLPQTGPQGSLQAPPAGAMNGQGRRRQAEAGGPGSSSGVGCRPPIRTIAITRPRARATLIGVLGRAQVDEGGLVLGQLERDRLVGVFQVDRLGDQAPRSADVLDVLSRKTTRIGYLAGSIPAGRWRWPTTSTIGNSSTPGRSGRFETPELVADADLEADRRQALAVARGTGSGAGPRTSTFIPSGPWNRTTWTSSGRTGVVGPVAGPGGPRPRRRTPAGAGPALGVTARPGPARRPAGSSRPGDLPPVGERRAEARRDRQAQRRRRAATARPAGDGGSILFGSWRSSSTGARPAPERVRSVVEPAGPTPSRSLVRCWLARQTLRRRTGCGLRGRHRSREDPRRVAVRDRDPPGPEDDRASRNSAWPGRWGPARPGRSSELGSSRDRRGGRGRDRGGLGGRGGRVGGHRRGRRDDRGAGEAGASTGVSAAGRRAARRPAGTCPGAWWWSGRGRSSGASEGDGHADRVHLQVDPAEADDHQDGAPLVGLEDRVNARLQAGRDQRLDVGDGQLLVAGVGQVDDLGDEVARPRPGRGPRR